MANTGIYWSPIEEDYLKQYYGKRNIKLMMFELDKSKTQIYMKAFYLGLTIKQENPAESKLIATGGRVTINGASTIHRMI